VTIANPLVFRFDTAASRVAIQLKRHMHPQQSSNLHGSVPILDK
jgi:hypothetical protein